jgi:hypothetical protein
MRHAAEVNRGDEEGRREDVRILEEKEVPDLAYTFAVSVVARPRQFSFSRDSDGRLEPRMSVRGKTVVRGAKSRDSDDRRHARRRPEHG